MSELKSFGKTNEKLQIGGFIAIGRDPRNGGDAYVADEKDAQLFIAAPDLLNACKAMLTGVESIQLTPREWGKSGLIDAKNKAYAAIQKAKGNA